jgi:mannose-6-phosphate isomerase-like protein (cupin superfamily)
MASPDQSESKREPRAELLDLTASELTGSGAILSRESDDLDLNLVRFAGGAGVQTHVNREVDVLLVAVAGNGVVTVNGEEFALAPGQALLIPKQTERAIRSSSEGEFRYLSIHRRRARLQPTRRA